MGLVSTVRLAHLLRRLQQPPSPSAAAHVVTHGDTRAACGLVVNEYLPHGAPRAVVIALHGTTATGKNDHRLRNFAQRLAESGIACITPTLPGLAGCRWEAEDIDLLAALVVEMAARHRRQVGLVGFSYGGSYALVAAAREAARSLVAWVIGFGVYHSLPDLQDRMWEHRADRPTTEAGWDDLVYVHLVAAHRHPESLPPGLAQRVHALLLGYCESVTAAQKRAFFHDHLEALDLVDVDRRERDATKLLAVSPAGQLAGVRCPIALVHDPHDGLVPASQAERVMAELSALPDPPPHELVTTELLQHVTPSNMFKVLDLARLFRVLSPLGESTPPIA